MRRRAARPAQLLAGIVVLAAVLRLWRIGHQSYWLDEAFTVNIVRGDFGGMLDGVRHTESTPPLYYALAWLWERVFGSGEAGLRSLSALFGVVTVPVAYLAARQRFGVRAALIAAALFAVNPYLVWYSQEARAYALLVLLTTAGLVFFLRAEQAATSKPARLKGSDPLSRGRLDLAGWAVLSTLALLTHYFAAFLVVPQAAWLLWRARPRGSAAKVALAISVPAAVGVALLPLAVAQKDAGHTLFIAGIPFGRRLVSIPKKLATGELGTPTPLIGIAVGAAIVLGVALSLRRGRGGGLLVALAAAALAIALVLKLAGLDYVFPRNLIEAFVPLLTATAGGLATERRAGRLVAGGLVVAGTALVIQVAYNASLERDDWRGAARALERPRPTAPRAIVVSPAVGRTPFRLYAPRAAPLRGPRLVVAEIDLLANARPPRFAPSRPPPGFRLVANRRTASWQIVRFRSRRPRLTGPNTLRGLRLEPGKGAALLVERPGR